MRKLSTVALVVMAAACGNDFVEIDATPAATADRIVGGFGFDGLPAVGAITYNGDQHCSGTLIGPRMVLTAAHCVDGFSASRLKFVIGEDLINRDYILDVVDAVAHPDWNSYALRNDIGYLVLAENAPIAPLPILEHMDASWVGADLFFVGYGVTNGYSGAGAGIKRAVWMSVSEVSSTTFRYADPGKNTCSGDSGGPAFYRDPAGNYFVAGVTSWGDGPCVDFGVDTRVDVFADFLGVDVAPPEDPCAGETFVGRCDGDQVVWCESDQVHVQNCPDYDGKTCVFDDAHQYYACGVAAEPPPPVDPCNGETYEGRCQGNSVVWCENEEVKSISCDNYTKSCGWDGPKGFYNCL
jgi:hypothetical protein